MTPRTAPRWREALRALGLPHVASSMDDWIEGEPPPDDRRLGVLTASRHRLEPFTSAFIPWAERLLSVRVAAAPEIELHNLHSPISQKPGLAKVRTHEALAAHLRRAREAPQVLVGDLNTPRRERADGSVWTFARDSRGGLRLDRGERWDEAELALIQGLEQHGMRDVYRELHGPGVKEVSWSAPRRGGGYRLDHVIASTSLRVLGCGYLHEPREAGLSDHSPMWAELDAG